MLNDLFQIADSPSNSGIDIYTHIYIKHGNNCTIDLTTNSDWFVIIVKIESSQQLKNISQTDQI